MILTLFKKRLSATLVEHLELTYLCRVPFYDLHIFCAVKIFITFETTHTLLLACG